VTSLDPAPWVKEWWRGWSAQLIDEDSSSRVEGEAMVRVRWGLLRFDGRGMVGPIPGHRTPYKEAIAMPCKASRGQQKQGDRKREMKGEGVVKGAAL